MDGTRIPPIPIVEAATLDDDDPRVHEALRVAFGEYGILHLAGHGLQESWLDELFATYAAFCAEPDAVKRATSRPDLWFQRGWTPPSTERAVAGSGQPDFKECWFACCTELDPFDAVLFPEINGGNVWPTGFDAFPGRLGRVALALQALGERVLAGCERALDLEPGELSARFQKGPHVTRLLRYLPLAEHDVDGGVLWGENHTDFCALTLLFGGRFLGPDGKRVEAPRDGSGLFLTSRSGDLLPGSPPPGCLVVQVGQQLEVLTGGTFVATPHEVRAPSTPGLSRLAGAHFMHLHTGQVLFPLAPFRSEEAVRRYRPPVLAGTYDTKILVDIGLAPREALDRLGYANQDRIAPQPGRARGEA